MNIASPYPVTPAQQTYADHKLYIRQWKAGLYWEGRGGGKSPIQRGDNGLQWYTGLRRAGNKIKRLILTYIARKQLQYLKGARSLAKRRRENGGGFW